MKKTVVFFTLLITSVVMFAQSGPAFPYQAVVRNAQNQLIKDSTFSIGVEIYQDSDLKFSETQRVTTNANGQFTMNIGGGTVVSGAMNDVTDWSVAKFRITYHLSEGDIVSEDAVSPVPYALQAANNAALTDLLNAMNARMDSLDHLVDSLSNLNHGGGTTAFTCGTSKVKDVDGNEYNTVQIGSQCWMAQNLRTKTHQYGNVWTKTDVDSAIYGRYYDWAAVMQGESGNTVQGICPTGWHVPSDVEWDTLTTYVSSVEAYKCNSSIASALSDSTGWKSSSICCAGDNSSATINITGFAAVPAGSFTDGFGGFGYDAYFWSATEYNNQMALCQSLHSLATGVSSYEDYKSHCYSVRCLRDAGIGGGNTPSTPATMNCEDVMNCLGDTLGRLNARITSQGETIDSLAKLVATQDSAINSLSNQMIPFNCGTSKVKDVDNNTYNTVQIGNQCWMAQNLRTKTHQYGNVWTKTDVDSAIYGRYYDWAAVMQGESGNKVQGICPTGWHVPSDAEWDTLTTYVNSVADYKCEGTNNYIAKALASKTGWNASGNSCAVGNNLEHNNATGFSVVPSGYYSSNNATCFNFGDYAFLWSATEGESGKVLCRVLNKGNFQVQSTNEEKNYGYSVRCVRDADTGGDTPATPATMSCEDVIECMGDTLGKLNTRITSQGTEIESLISTVETLSTTVTTQSETIDSLNHIVDSLSNLNHGGGPTPSAIFICDSSTVKDVDQNEYHTVAIGNQCWMKENLRTKTHTYGNVYTNPDIDSVIYGCYYDWEAIMQVGDVNFSDFTPSGLHQGICPTGWHVPSRDEWNTLISYVNSEIGYRCDGNDGCIANALSTDTGWEDAEGCCAGHASATLNKTGFSAVPSGYKFVQTDTYEGNGMLTFLGSVTQSSEHGVHILVLRMDEPTTSTAGAALKMDGISVRCLRDAGIVGTAGGNESGIGGGGTPAEVADGQPCPGAATVSDADGNTYNTVKIGSQCWMKENLRTMPRTGRSWSPGGDVSKVDDYGLLYDWTAVMQVADANNTLIAVQDKHQGICPNGWHVPSQAEWETLSHYTFDNYRCTDCEEIDPIWQSDLAYCVAKALCSAAWNDGGSSCNANSNAIGKNVTGFSILPAGARFGETPGSFGANAYFWSSTQHNGTTANSWFLGAFASSLNSYTDNKPAGLSLRCIRD